MKHLQWIPDSSSFLSHTYAFLGASFTNVAFTKPFSFEVIEMVPKKLVDYELSDSGSDGVTRAGGRGKAGHFGIRAPVGQSNPSIHQVVSHSSFRLVEFKILVLITSRSLGWRRPARMRPC